MQSKAKHSSQTSNNDNNKNPRNQTIFIKYNPLCQYNQQESDNNLTCESILIPSSISIRKMTSLIDS